MKSVLKYLCFAFALFVMACKFEAKKNNVRVQNKIVDDYSAKIDSLIQTTNPRKFNGVILITKNGKIVYSKAQGYSDFESKTPISLDDNFRIQSNSKQITAVLILKEVEKGTIDLQSSIKKYLPNLKQPWGDKVTVHQLLNMSSGIVDLENPLIFEAGTAYKYSNAAYGLLGRILESVSGNSYKQLANNLFNKLEMSDTFCYEFDKKSQNLINGYRGENNHFGLVKFDETGNTEASWHQFAPVGGIISNLKDLSYLGY